MERWRKKGGGTWRRGRNVYARASQVESKKEMESRVREGRRILL